MPKLLTVNSKEAPWLIGCMRVTDESMCGRKRNEWVTFYYKQRPLLRVCFNLVHSTPYLVVIDRQLCFTTHQIFVGDEFRSCIRCEYGKSNNTTQLRPNKFKNSYYLPPRSVRRYGKYETTQLVSVTYIVSIFANSETDQKGET